MVGGEVLLQCRDEGPAQVEWETGASSEGLEGLRRETFRLSCCQGGGAIKAWIPGKARAGASTLKVWPSRPQHRIPWGP